MWEAEVCIVCDAPIHHDRRKYGAKTCSPECAGKREEAQRALDVHERGCPAAMSVNGCIAIAWTADFEEV